MKLLSPLVLVLAACTEPHLSVGTRGGDNYAVVVDVPPEINGDLDLLFVVDNTTSMAQRQRELTLSFEKLISHLRFAEGGLPNLHIGVVSTDLGAGGQPVAGCGVLGDRGVLQAEPRRPICSGPGDASFLRDYRSADVRDTNYEDSHLTDAFGCIAELGTTGCEFEQPLEAMRLALDGYTAENQGFIRPGAALGVVLLTDEDDCSVFDNGLFDPMLDGTGQVSKFRCFQHGVQCNGDDVRLEGEYAGCEPKRDSDYLVDVAQYASFLDRLKFAPEQVVVTGMIGDANLVEVEVDLDERPQLVPACHDDNRGAAYPAIRMQHFLDATAYGGEVSSLCGEKPLDALAQTAKRLRKVLGTHCLDGDVVDVDPETAGLQVDCRVYDRTPDGRSRAIPACDDAFAPEGSATVPCYAIKTGPSECGDFRPHQLALQVWRGAWDAPQPSGTHTIGECLVAQPDRQ